MKTLTYGYESDHMYTSKNGTFDNKSCCKFHGNELATALRKVIFMRFLRGSKDLNVVEGFNSLWCLMHNVTNGGAEHGDHDVLKSEIWVWKILEDKLSPQKGL
ncbi:hypothetical protein Tco_1220568 [Tanacetum coccineum]